MVRSLERVETDQVQERLLVAAGAPRRNAPATQEKIQARAKVLIVDDEPDIVLSLSKRLRFAGYDIVSAGDGEEATRVAVRTQPDVIILDIGMPCGDGHSVAERIRSNRSTMFAKIIFLTARVSEIDRQKALDGGAFGYLTKPFKSEELLDMIESALEDNSC